MFDTTKPSNRIVGRVAGLGLTDEINDRHYIVVDSIDGKVHYADVGHLRPEFVPDKGMIVAIENKAVEDSDKQRTRLRILSYLNLEKLVDAEGATWLDKELIGKSQERLVQTGFGNEASAAIALRRQWLVTQGLGTIDSANSFRAQPRMIEQLRQQTDKTWRLQSKRRLASLRRTPHATEAIALKNLPTPNARSAGTVVCARRRPFLP